MHVKNHNLYSKKEYGTPMCVFEGSRGTIQKLVGKMEKQFHIELSKSEHEFQGNQIRKHEELLRGNGHQRKMTV